MIIPHFPFLFEVRLMENLESYIFTKRRFYKSDRYNYFPFFLYYHKKGRRKRLYWLSKLHKNQYTNNKRVMARSPSEDLRQNNCVKFIPPFFFCKMSRNIVMHFFSAVVSITWFKKKSKDLLLNLQSEFKIPFPILIWMIDYIGFFHKKRES